MSYLRTVAIAIALCAIVLILCSAVYVLVPLLHGSATGLGIVWRSVIESLIASIALGWLTGTIWYFVRHLIGRLSS